MTIPAPRRSVELADIGPVQLIALGVSGPDFRLEIATECRRLGSGDAVRVLDAVVVHKDEHGWIALERIGRSAGDDPAVQPPLLSHEHAWEVVGDLPQGSAAVLLLVEHHWALPIRAAMARAGAVPLSNCFVSPVDLVDLGLLVHDDDEEVRTCSVHDASRDAPVGEQHDVSAGATERTAGARSRGRSRS